MLQPRRTFVFVFIVNVVFDVTTVVVLLFSVVVVGIVVIVVAVLCVAVARFRGRCYCRRCAVINAINVFALTSMCLES